jgi:hypothetical protein
MSMRRKNTDLNLGTGVIHNGVIGLSPGYTWAFSGQSGITEKDVHTTVSTPQQNEGLYCTCACAAPVPPEKSPAGHAAT